MAPRIPTVQLGPGGPSVPAIGQGTWQMERDDRQACIESLRRGIELGARLIDTAEMYGSGAVEELVGQAIEGLRDQVFLVTKVLPSNATRQGTVEACKRSLDRLGTDQVDLYLLHWPSRHPIEETMAAFQELLEDGLTRYVGVSNFPLDAFMEADKALGEDHRLVTDQVLYWLGARNTENELLNGLAEREVPVMAYSPFGSGPLPGSGTEQGQALATVAKRHDATPHQVALAWTIRSGQVLAIPKASSPAHLEENLGAADLALTEEDLSELDRAFPAGEETRLQML